MSATRGSVIAGMMLALAVAVSPAVAADAAQDSNQLPQAPERAQLARQLVAEATQLEANGELDGALAKLQLAVAAVPAWATPRGMLGRLYQMQGQDQLAKEQYEKHQLLSLLGQIEGDPDPLLLKLAHAEGLITFLINHERLTRGLCVLSPSAKLAQVARQHSNEMRELDYFGHVSPVKEYATSLDRFEQAYGCKPRGLAENLARRCGTLYSFTLDNMAETHEDLMKSPKHRDSILWDQMQHVGVGIAVNDHGDYWITELLVRLR